MQSNAVQKNDHRLASFSINSIETPTKIPKLKHQTKRLFIDLDKDNTLLCFQCPKTVIIITMGLCFILFILKYFIIDSPIFSLITSMSNFILAIMYFSKLNVYVVKQGLRSFQVWYKLIHAMIAIIVRQIYFDSWIYGHTSDKIIPSNVGNNNIFYHFTGSLSSFNFISVIFIVSLLDSLATRSNKIKRVGLIFCILIFISLWLTLYFNTNAQYLKNIDKSFNIYIFNRKHIYYLRSMVLSSLFKLNVFLCAQFYKNLRV